MRYYNSLPRTLKARADALAVKMSRLELSAPEQIAWLADQLCELREHELQRGATVFAISKRLNERARIAAAALERFAQLAVDGAINAAR